jgi:predicted RNA-binding protein YlqC (UPF0109 family)
VEGLVEYLARSLVDDPDGVSIEAFDEEDGTIVIEVRVAEDDVGQLIGRGGRTINALRTVVRACSVKQGTRVLVDVMD